MPEPDDIVAPRPWVLIATFCQAAIIEANTGNLSVIRVLDTLPLFGATREMQQPIPVQLTMALLLKSGEMNGQYNIKVHAILRVEYKHKGRKYPFTLRVEIAVSKWCCQSDCSPTNPEFIGSMFCLNRTLCSPAYRFG